MDAQIDRRQHMLYYIVMGAYEKDEEGGENEERNSTGQTKSSRTVRGLIFQGNFVTIH